MPHIHVPKDAVWRLRCYAVPVDHTSELLGSSPGMTSASFKHPVFVITTDYHQQFSALRGWSTMIFASNGLIVYRSTMSFCQQLSNCVQICALSVFLLSMEVLAVHHPRESGGPGQTSLPGAQPPGKIPLPIHSTSLWPLIIPSWKVRGTAGCRYIVFAQTQILGAEVQAGCGR